MIPACDLAAVRRTIKAELGGDTLARLMEPNRLFDLLGFCAAWGLFLGLFVALGTTRIGPTWALAFVVQGFALQLVGLVSHDLFVHRRVGGPTVSWIGSLACTIPRFSKPSAYEMVHLEHHRYAGTERDTEAYKRDLDTRARRLLFLTVAGVKLIQGRKLARPDPVTGAKPVGYHDLAAARPELTRRLVIEKWLVRWFLVLVVLAAVMWPRLVLLGYLAPALLMAPVASTVRTILEHSEANPDNPFHVATFYRTGPLSRVLFLWDSGDCHLIHHLYATIPFYRVGAALTLMRPILLRNGVVERRSFLQLLRGWFVENHPHGTVWPASSRQAPSA